MPNPSPYTVVREILTANLDLTADEVMTRAKKQGVTTRPDELRRIVHNTRSELRKRAAQAAPAAGQAKAASRPAVPAVPAAPAGQVAPEFAAVLANVARVNQVLGLCGGTENTRQAAEAVRACGGVDAFLQHLELVAGIRGSASPA